MATYAELKAQIESMTRQAEEVRRTEIAEVVSEIREKMRVYGISIEDLTGKTRKTGYRVKSKTEAKYRGPNGELWSGGPGRRPDWVKEALSAGYSLEDLLIKDEHSQFEPHA